MRISEIIAQLRIASFPDKTGARSLGVTASGQDVALPYFQAGWVNIADSQYTAVSPLVILAGVRTQLTIDGLGAATNRTYANGLHPDVWSGNVFKPAALGDTYALRWTATLAHGGAGTGEFATLEMDIGGSIGVAAVKRINLTKGVGIDDRVTLDLALFCLDTFGANGGKLYLTPSADTEVHSQAIFIQRTFTP